MPALILASSSPYRRALLQRLGLSFQTISPDIDESPGYGEAADALAERLARTKAAAISASHPSALVIGSDQVAECNGQLLGKPGTSSRALAQLQVMQGRTIVFQTAVAIALGDRIAAAVVPTEVHMRQLSNRQLQRYIEHDHPLDCAGAFKSERAGIALTELMRSDDPTALVGLPLIATVRLLSEFGLELP